MEKTLQPDNRDDAPSLKGGRPGDLHAKRRNEAPFTDEWNEVDDCFLCLSKESLWRDYPRDLTEFEARFAYEPACRDLLVPTLLAGKFSVAPSSEE